MPKMLSDANTKLTWVPDGGIVNFHAPTAAELNAGTTVDMSCLVTANDFALGATTDQQINDPALCSSTNSTLPGRANYTAEMNFFRWTTVPEDKAWTTFTAKGIAGYLVRRIGTAYTTVYAAADKVQVYQVLTGTPQILTPAAEGGFHKFREVFSVQDNVDERATVA